MKKKCLSSILITNLDCFRVDNNFFGLKFTSEYKKIHRNN